MLDYGEDKLLLITKEWYGEEDCGIKINEINSTIDAVRHFGKDIAWNAQAMDELLKNPEFLKSLDARGFRNVAKIKDEAEKVILAGRFYIQTGLVLKEVDLANLSAVEIRDLAEGRPILQLVDQSCLKDINPLAHKKIADQKKKIKAEADKRKDRVAARADKKKLREIEKARKLLEKHGEKI